MAEWELAKRSIDEQDWDAASEHARALADLQDSFLPREHPDRGEPERLLASIEFGRGNTQSAITHARTALQRFESSPTRRGEPRVLDLRKDLANALMDEDELDGARQQAQAVLQVAEPGSLAAVTAQLRLADQRVAGWLDQLGVSVMERGALGY